MIGFIKKALSPNYEVAIIDPDDHRREALQKHFLYHGIKITSFDTPSKLFDHKKFNVFDVILIPLHAPDFRGPQARIEIYRRDPMTPVIIYGHQHEQKEFEHLVTIGELLKADDLQSFLQIASKKQSGFEHMMMCQWSETTETHVAMEM